MSKRRGTEGKGEEVEERAGGDIMSGTVPAALSVPGSHPSHTEMLDVGWLLRISLF